MSEIARQIAQLSPEKRELLLKRLGEKAEPARGSVLVRQPRYRSHFPVSFAQQRLWLLDQFAPGTGFYNIFAAGSMDAPLNVTVLESALNELMKRHESLRTSFGVQDGEPVQIVLPSLKLPLTVVNLQHMPERQREVEAWRLAGEEAQRPFDLTMAPLFRAAVLRLTPRRHVFLLTMHHIISDGWSLGVFWRELEVVYTALAAGRPPALPELSIQYVDYAVWERERLQGAVLEGHLTYWRKQLADLSVLYLPADHRRPAVQNYRGATLDIVLPHSLATRLKELSRREGITLFMTMLAGFKLLLHRYSGQTDIVVGSPITNRHRAEVEGVIGFFVNTLVMRTDLSGNPRVRELLGRVREMVVSAFEHQELPFERIVAELRPERDLSRNPLFQVMFQLFTLAGSSHAGGGSNSGQMGVNRGTAMFDLAFHMWEGKEDIRGHIEYSTDLLTKKTIERMVGHWQELLEGMAARPEQRIGELGLLSRREQQQVVVEWNATDAEKRGRSSLVELFEEQVNRTPRAEAVADRRERVSYAELNRRANQLAHYLRGLGVKTESVVGLCLERSVDAVVGMLGIQKAGGAYLPLDPAYPAERLAWMVEDAGAGVVVTTGEWMERVPIKAVRVVSLGRDADQIAGEVEENLEQRWSPDSAAYVIYTSGSTGRPKGVIGLHGATVNRLEWMWAEYPYSEDAVSCQKTALSFVDSVWETFGGLLKGVRTVILGQEEVKDTDELLKRLREEAVTRIVVVPSLMRVLLEASKELGSELPKLREWFVSGEELPQQVWERFRERVPYGRLINLYGSSEVAGDVTWYELGSGSGVAIGRPMTNTRVYVLDEQLRLLPVGVPGEIYVGGMGLARGYIGRPDLTAERFLPDGYSGRAGARMYRTGDVGRWRADGTLEYTGRQDQQVKVRGFRIELGEIEAELKTHPGVKDSVVVARPSDSGEQRLVAYVVPQQEASAAAGDLRRYIQERLPGYMIPSGIVLREALPMTANGKVNREALPPVEGEQAAPEHEYVPPRNAVEQVLAGIWAEVLGRERVSVQDNFFELGGHSLMATQLISRIRGALHVLVPLRAVFEAPTIAALATHMTDDAKERLIVEKTAQLLLAVHQMSEEQAARLLSDHSVARP